MKKRWLLIIIFCLLISFLVIGNIEATGLNYEEGDTMKQGIISSGVSYKKVEAVTSTDAGTSGNQNVSYVKMDANAAKIVAWAGLDKGGIKAMNMVELAQNYEQNNPGYKVLAGINADYFQVQSGRLYPTSAYVSQGNVYKYHNYTTKYSSLAISDNGDKFIVNRDNEVTDNYFLTVYDEDLMPIKEIKLDGINMLPNKEQTTVYLNYSGEVSVNPSSTLYKVANPIFDFAMSDLNNKTINFMQGRISEKVTYVSNKPTIITNSTEVNELLKTCPMIRIQKYMSDENGNYDNIIGFGSQPLANGVVKEFSEIGDQGLSFCKSREPRSVLGLTEEGSVILCAIDGRRSSVNDGVNLREEAYIMQALGCENAFNFDGGGSTQLVIRENNGFTYLNNPNLEGNGSYRKVCNAILLVVPDVFVNLVVSENNAVTLNYVAQSNVTNVQNEVYLNDKLIFSNEKTGNLGQLNEYQNNFVSVKTKYQLNGVSYTKIFKTIHLMGEHINDVQKQKPTNFDLDITPTDKGFKCNVTVEDPDNTITKIYLVNGDNKKLCLKDASGYKAEFETSTTQKYEFQIEYYYRIDTYLPVKDLDCEVFTYIDLKEPLEIEKIDYVNYEKSFSGKVTFSTNQYQIKKVILKYGDSETVLDENYSFTVINPGENNELLFEITYAYQDVDMTKTVSETYAFTPHKSGCEVFNGFKCLISVSIFGLLLFFKKKSLNK